MRLTSNDLALLTRLMRQREVDRAELCSGDQRTAARLLRAQLIYQRHVRTEGRHGGGHHVAYILNPRSTSLCCDPALLTRVCEALPGFLNADPYFAEGDGGPLLRIVK